MDVLVYIMPLLSASLKNTCWEAIPPLAVPVAKKPVHSQHWYHIEGTGTMISVRMDENASVWGLPRSIPNISKRANMGKHYHFSFFGAWSRVVQGPTELVCPRVIAVSQWPASCSRSCSSLSLSSMGPYDSSPTSHSWSMLKPWQDWCIETNDMVHVTSNYTRFATSNHHLSCQRWWSVRFRLITRQAIWNVPGSQEWTQNHWIC